MTGGQQRVCRKLGEKNYTGEVSAQSSKLPSNLSDNISNGNGQ